MDPLAQINQLGAMGKISTGHWLLDFALCLMLPALLRYATAWIQTKRVCDILARCTASFLPRSPEVCTRSIRCETLQVGWYASASDSHNEVLQRAILMYINGLDELTRAFKTAHIILQDPAEGIALPREAETATSKLESYRVMAVPPHGLWVDVRVCSRGTVQLRVEQTRTIDGNQKTTKLVVIDIRATAARGEAPCTAEALVADFVNAAYQAYVDVVRKQVDSCRYLYEPQGDTDAKD